MNSTRKQALVLSLIALVMVFALASNTVLARNAKTYGKALSTGKVVAIEHVLDHPDEFLGKTVKVEGLINGVCEKRGCWMTLASKSADFKEIRVKVEDGVMVFPVEAMGKMAVAEGKLVKIEMSLEQTVAYKQHHAEEHGEDFDPASVTEPLVYFQIDGIGAEIY
jgi:hypothetical protein